MEAKQSENPNDLTHSGPVPSDIETAESSSSLQNVETDKDINTDIDGPAPSENEIAECSSSHQNVETDKASLKLEITTLIGSLYKAAVEGKIDDFQEHKNHLDQLLTPNKNTILRIHITARPLDFVEGIPKLIHKLFPRAQNTSVFETTWSEYFLEGIHELIDKLFPCAQKTAQSKKESSLKFVEGILDMCPDLLLQVNIKGETPLHIAARHGHVDIVDLLIRKFKDTLHNDQEKGVGPARNMLRMMNKAEDTALQEAVRFNHPEIVGKLIKEDPDCQYDANAAGETPFYMAVERGYHSIIFKMYKTLSFSNCGGPKGRTALHAAVLRNDIGMTWLISSEKETLAKIKDDGGWIPLHYAAYYGYMDIVEVLLDNDESAAYIKTGNEKKTDSKTNKEKKTALHIAASRGKVDIMKKLISRCPDCSELVDERGWNVLHFAIESRNPEAIKVVLENSSLSNLVNEFDNNGNTPLHQLADLGFYMPSFICHPKVDKQAFNKQHLNALDITSGKNEVSKTQKRLNYCLKNNGIKKGLRVEEDGDIIAKIKEANKGEGPSSYDGNGKNKDGDIIKEAREQHLLVATLIATVTFAAGFTVPGGYKDEGTAILTRSAAFKTFVITDTIAMMLSSSAVFLHLFMALDRDKERIIKRFINQSLLIIFALYAMVVAYVAGTYAVLGPSLGLAIAVCVQGSIFWLLSGYFIFEYIPDLLGFLYGKIRSLSLQSSKGRAEDLEKKRKAREKNPDQS